MSRKTILYVDHTAQLSGGELALLNLVSGLDRTSFYPIVALAADGPLRPKLEAAGIETHILPLSESVRDVRKDALGFFSLLRLRQIGQCLVYAWRLSRFARARRVDLLHANSLKSDLYGGIAGRLAGLPVVWHVRDHINDNYLPAPVAFAFQRLARVIPHVVIVNSHSTLRCLASVSPSRTAVVYSGCPEVVHDGCHVEMPDEASPLPLEDAALGQDSPPVITLIGRITPWKGQDVFLRAAAETLRDVPDAQFWIIGSPLFGEQAFDRSLRALAEELGISKQVKFWGFRDDVPALVRLSTMIVHASTLPEPFGQVVIEGMAAGKPVIATEGGGLPEIVVPGKTGLLVPMGDSGAMASAIRTLLADPPQARRMGEAGQQRVRER